MVCLLLTSVRSTAAAEGDNNYPFPQHTVYAANTIYPNHRTQEQQDDDARAFYDAWKASYIVNAGVTIEGNTLYRVVYGTTLPDKDRTVSEGQGYGMIIVVLMAGYDPQAQIIFDGLWEFSRAHPSKIDSRLMDWDVPDTTSGNNSAFDGDADMAYALLLAHKQWGSNGHINYQAAAAIVISAVLESTIGPESRLPTFGDWVEPTGSVYNQYTPRTSDFIPAHFRAYGRAVNNPVWFDVVSNTQTVITALQANHSPITGLLPDFIVPISPSDHTPQPAPASFLEGANDGNYFYNAGRDPWRIATDALLNDDPTSRAQAAKMTIWAENATGGNPNNLKSGYELDGTPVTGSDYFSTFFASPMGVAA
ncbi:MAG: beta-glucanase, partial [Candidatus Electrothrix sp. AR4]|nr:beta-glucanase [Candidatus Electrothrix sp. AR4]